MTDTDRLAALLAVRRILNDHIIRLARYWRTSHIETFANEAIAILDDLAEGVTLAPAEGLREAYLAGVRRGASDGMEAYPEVANDYLAIRQPVAPAEGLDVDRLENATRAAFHELRWCKWSDPGHAVAHDDEDEDGYRGALISTIAREYAALTPENDHD